MEKLPFEPDDQEEESTALVTLNVHPDQDDEVQKLYDAGLELLKGAKALVIASQDDFEDASNQVSSLAGALKSLEAKRQEYIRPLTQHVNQVNDWFKGFKAPMVEADKLIRDTMKAWHQKKQQEAARREMELTGELSEPVGVTEVAPVSRTHRGDFTTTSMKKAWAFEVEDFSKLPDEYKLPDLTKIRRVVMAMKREGEPIPGVRAWLEDQLAVSAKK